MAVEDPNELDRVDREIRINELKHEAEELVGGEMEAFEAEDCPPEVSERFWQGVVDYEKLPWTTNFEQLVKAGVELPAPEELNDEQLNAKLWEVVRKLAEFRVFIGETDHLSDRELYSHLWHETLRSEIKAMPVSPHSAWHVDLLGSGSEEDNHLFLKYYADDDWRRMWAKDFPDAEIPPHEDPPYDRDRHLPKPTYGEPGEEPFGEDE